MCLLTIKPARLLMVFWHKASKHIFYNHLSMFPCYTLCKFFMTVILGDFLVNLNWGNDQWIGNIQCIFVRNISPYNLAQLWHFKAVLSKVSIRIIISVKWNWCVRRFAPHLTCPLPSSKMAAITWLSLLVQWHHYEKHDGKFKGKKSDNLLGFDRW